MAHRTIVAGEYAPTRQNMRDLDALLGSLVNIDRNSLIAVLSSEAEAAKGIAKSTGHRTAAQRFKRRAAVELAARIVRILSFLQHGEIAADMSEADVSLCKSLEVKLATRGRPGE